MTSGMDEIGEFICDENPYTDKMQLADGWQNHDVSIEQAEGDDEYAHYWYFAGRAHRVKKALRIKYTYTDDDGKVQIEHLLVGYEGGPGQ
jgi:hypothetical protein